MVILKASGWGRQILIKGSRSFVTPCFLFSKTNRIGFSYFQTKIMHCESFLLNLFFLTGLIDNVKKVHLKIFVEQTKTFMMLPSRGGSAGREENGRAFEG